MDINAFINKWSRSQLSERAASQEHFIDLCRLLDVRTPAEIDPTGETFTFETGARVSGPASEGSNGDRGWADVWYRGVKAGLLVRWVKLPPRTAPLSSLVGALHQFVHRQLRWCMMNELDHWPFAEPPPESVGRVGPMPANIRLVII